MKESESIINELISLVDKWEPILTGLPAENTIRPRNSQNRSIKQILGHMIDSVSNNTHRIVHLQYQPGPLLFPNYATFGNNDRWISVQNYQNEDWTVLIQLWKFSMLHICHVIENVNDDKLNNEWIAGPERNVTLKTMIIDFPVHIRLHLSEINDLIRK
jgi:hypothetical protein